MFTDSQYPDLILRALILGPLCLLWIITLTRIVGLRSFSKMTAFDFIVTVATGSLLANAATATSWSSFFQPTLAISSLMGLQWILARGRKESDSFADSLGNQPVLLYAEGEFQREAMAAQRICENDLYAKMREANALQISEIKAIVLETTGDISVLHGGDLETKVLTGVCDC